MATWLHEASDAFEQETGIKIVPVEIPNSIYLQTLFNQFISGTGPDVLAIQGTVESYLPMNGLIPLDDFVESSSLDMTQWATYEVLEDFNLN